MIEHERKQINYTSEVIANLQIDLFVWWEKWVVEKPVSPWMDSVWSVWEIGTITIYGSTFSTHRECKLCSGEKYF